MATFAQLVEIFATGYQVDGSPVSGGTVTVYAAGTTTPAYVWYNRAKSSPTTAGVSSFTLDAQGRLGVWADGNYKFVIKDAAGVTLTTLDGCDYSTGISGYTAVDQYVADLTGASSAVAGITAAQNAGSHLLFQPGTYLIDTSTTLSDAATVLKGAVFSVSSGQTLTINGSFDAGLYQVFSGAGTVLFGVGAVDEVYPEWWGAVGDDNAATGATNLAACQGAAASIATNGGTIALTNGVYYISDTWNMRQSNTYLRIAPRATLKCTAATSKGQTVSFCEGLLYGGSDSSMLENVGFYGGGTVRNTSASNTENAIAFSRVRNYSCIGMNVPECTRKGITAQVNVSEGRILNNKIGTTGDSGITIEQAVGTTAEGYTQILGNYIGSAGLYGIAIIGTGSPATTFYSVVIDNNIIAACVDDGISVLRGNGVRIGSGNEIRRAGVRGYDLNTVENLTVDGGVIGQSGKEGVVIANATGQVSAGNVIINNPSADGAGSYVGINLSSNTPRVQLFGMQVSGSNHSYAVSGNTTYDLIGGNYATGTLGYFYGTVNYLNVVMGSNLQHNLKETQQSVAYAAAVTPNYNLGGYILLGELTGNITINDPTNMMAGQFIRIRLVQDAVGGRTVTWGTNMRFAGTLSTTPSTVSAVEFIYDGAKWRGGVLYTGQAI